ncbi:MAG: hypothetical protein CFE45_40685, partial [Burkholderiales bacterium PBB5]
TALLLAGTFLALRVAVNAESDPTFHGLRALAPPRHAAPAAASPPVQAAAAPAPVPRLATFLKPEVDAGLVEVRDYADRSVVRVRGDGLFEPGSAQVQDRVRPVLDRIAQALQAVPGPVLVTGHTDNRPIRSLRYPSNWHLSQDRAQAVRALLAPRVGEARLRAEGRADAEPLQDNASPA